MFVLSVSQWPTSDLSFSNASAPLPAAGLGMSMMLKLKTSTSSVFVKLFIDRPPWRMICVDFTRVSCCSRSRRHTVALRGVTHDQSHDTARQNDFEIVAVLKVSNDEREHKSHGQTEQNAERHGIHLARENAGRYSSDQSLDRRAEDDSHQLRSHSGSEPGRPAVDGTEHGTEQEPQEHFVHRDPPIEFPLLLWFYTTNSGFPLSLSVKKKQNQDAHRQVRCNQQDKETIAAVKAPGLLQNSFIVSADSEPVQVARNVQSHFLDFGIAVRRRRGSRFSADGR